MELVEGTTLGSRIARGPLDGDEVRRIGQELAEALAYAHDAGVVHRDVKPANVLLDPRGRAKLADFGIARLVGDTVRHTRTGTTIGTAAYLAPEQVQGEDVSGATDVYALGLVLLEALTGEQPFGGAPVEAAVARLHRDPEVPAGDPHADLLRAMTARDPGQRPAAADVAAALGGPITAASPAPTAVLTTPPGATAAGTTTGTAPTAPFTDRAGDALARHSTDLLTRVRAVPPHTRATVGAVAAILLFLVVVALASGDEGTSEPTPIPDDTPSELRAPLQDLHDAVNDR
jgi:serine/threonine protein kinase